MLPVQIQKPLNEIYNQIQTNHTFQACKTFACNPDNKEKVIAIAALITLLMIPVIKFIGVLLIGLTKLTLLAFSFAVLHDGLRFFVNFRKMIPGLIKNEYHNDIEKLKNNLSAGMVLLSHLVEKFINSSENL